MKRRSFLKGLAIACAGIATGASLLSDRCTATEIKLKEDGWKFEFDPEPLRFDYVNYQGEWKWVIKDTFVGKIQYVAIP